MQIGKALARQIRTKAKTILNRELAIANSSGIIMAANSGVGDFAADALKACQEGRQVTSTLQASRILWVPFVYENQTLGVFGISVDQGQVTPEAISLLQGLAEVIVHQYLLIDHVQSTETMRGEFLRDMLAASSVDPDDIHSQADILQINLRTPQAVILAQVDQFEERLRKGSTGLSAEEQHLELSRESEKIIHGLKKDFMNFPDNVMGYIGNDTFVILKGIGGTSPNTMNTIRFLTEKGEYIYKLLQDLQLNLPVTVAVGQYYPDLGGLRKSYQDARLALDVGTKVWGKDRVYHIKQVGMFITLANIGQDRKAELAHQILHPLLRDQQLYKTVKEFLANGLNLTDAAEKLHIHRNTLIYRLDKTKKLIGLDPRHFDDALQIKLGLMFYQPT